MQVVLISDGPTYLRCKQRTYKRDKRYKHEVENKRQGADRKPKVEHIQVKG